MNVFFLTYFVLIYDTCRQDENEDLFMIALYRIPAPAKIRPFCKSGWTLVPAKTPTGFWIFAGLHRFVLNFSQFYSISFTVARMLLRTSCLSDIVN